MKEKKAEFGSQSYIDCSLWNCVGFILPQKPIFKHTLIMKPTVYFTTRNVLLTEIKFQYSCQTSLFLSRLKLRDDQSFHSRFAIILKNVHIW